MFLCEVDELSRDASVRVQLERMFARSGLEKLVKALFKVDRRRAGHVVKVITFPIPGQRWTHGGAISRVVEVVRAGEILCPGKSRRSVAKIRCVIVQKVTAILARGAASESDAHSEHRLHGRCLDA